MSSTFPLLSEREITQCLIELGMNASVELLQKPSFEFVQPIYENLVTALVGVTRCGGRARSRQAGGRAGGRNSLAPAAGQSTPALIPHQSAYLAGRSCSSRSSVQ